MIPILMRDFNYESKKNMKNNNSNNDNNNKKKMKRAKCGLQSLFSHSLNQFKETFVFFRCQFLASFLPIPLSVFETIYCEKKFSKFLRIWFSSINQGH